MFRKIFLIIFILFFCNQSYAKKFSVKEGDILENEVSFGKNKFPLPPGKFKVAISKKWLDFRNLLLIQTDEDTGVIKWKIKLMATGSTNEKNSSWVPSKMCDEKDNYYLKANKGKPRFSCWSVSHSTSDQEDVVRLSISNNYFSFNQTMNHKIKADQSILSKSKNYETTNNLNSPSMFVVSRHHYGDKSKLYESEYYYNPEFDGIPKSKNYEWSSSEFHVSNINNFPEHEEFLKKFVGISANLVDRFNKLNKVKGSLSLNPEENLIKISANVEKNNTKTKQSSNEKKDIINQIKGLKELLDAGAITQDEFEKAKKKILN